VAFFVHFMPLIYNSMFFIMPDQWNVIIVGERQAWRTQLEIPVIANLQYIYRQAQGPESIEGLRAVSTAERLETGTSFLTG